MKNALCRKPSQPRKKVASVSKEKQEQELPVIGSSYAEKVIVFMNPDKRVMTQKVTIFYDAQGEPIWVSYKNKILGDVYKQWRDYCSLTTIISIGDTRELALSVACEIKSTKSKRHAMISLKNYNKTDQEFGCEFVQIIKLSYYDAMRLAIKEGLGDVFGHTRKKELYADGIVVYHPSFDRRVLLKKLAKRVHTVVRKNQFGFYLNMSLYGYVIKVYINTNTTRQVETYFANMA